MAVPFTLPQNSQPIIDARGVVNRPWYLFFQAVFTRIGGSSGTGNAALDALIEDIRTDFAMAPDATAAVATLETGFIAYQAAQAVINAAQDAATLALAARVSDLETLGAFA